MIPVFIVLMGVLYAGQSQCVPTSEMEALARSGGYEIVRKSAPGDSEAWACGDVNGDGRLDLCARLAKGGTAWKAGCFISREERYKFESMSDSDQEGLHAIAPDNVSLEVIKKGTKMRWANDAAEVSLLHDCVSVGVHESASRLYCYNGAYFLSMQMSD